MITPLLFEGTWPTPAEVARWLDEDGFAVAESGST
jgi:hypothetical protein